MAAMISEPADEFTPTLTLVGAALGAGLALGALVAAVWWWTR